MQKFHFFFGALLHIVLLCFLSSAASGQTLKYNYDALGRVTTVEDSVNGNRSFEYDPAGNRTKMYTPTSGNTTPSILPAPIIISNYQSNYCVWSSAWQPVQGATYYRFADTLGNEKDVYATSTTLVCGQGQTPDTQKPKWVKACSNGSCGYKGIF